LPKHRLDGAAAVVHGRRFNPLEFSMTSVTSAYVLPVLLLVASNVFMTFAWYGHLNYTSKPLWMAVMVSWGIAFFEYWLAVPANRIGYTVYSAAQLKTMQEVITFAVFSVFSIYFLKQDITINHLIGFSLIAAGAFFVFRA
jgi:uncharacterized protein (DUF486 family)